VITTAGGAAAELVSAGRTGALVRPGDPAHLATVVERVFSEETAQASMRSAARATYEAQFTADVNYQQMMTIYREARAGVAGGVAHAAHDHVLDAIPASDEAGS
jgi:glycosyltransferase involved in cell wall biosynthesis